MTELPRTPPRIAASLVDPLTYAEAHGLHNDFTFLRANLPLSRAEVTGFDPFWVVTKHADIAEISRQNALFHNGDRPTTLTDAASGSSGLYFSTTPAASSTIVEVGRTPRRLMLTV